MMDRIVQQITERFLEQLPEGRSYYRLDEFRSWDFPLFFVRRIKIELERNLAESMMIPKTDWADTESESVQHAWDEFVNAIHAEARLPVSYARAVLETVAADLLANLVQPRKNIPETIFGTQKELEYDQLKKKLKNVVVFRHFSRLILRYMQRKDLEILTKERCITIINNADQRLTRNYSPLNWAQLLEPLFDLSGGTVDTNLLRLFFEDKNRPKMAHKFDLVDEELTRAQFIEVLSSLEVENLKSKDGNERVKSKQQPQDDDSSTLTEGTDENPQSTEKEPEFTINIGKSDGESEEEKSETSFADSLNAAFASQDADEQTGEDDLKNVFYSKGNEQETPSGEQETPIWMRYMSDNKAGNQTEQEVEGNTPDHDKPLNGSDHSSKEEAGKLNSVLADKREYFIKEIFRGSERAYEEALHTIASYQNWHQATKFIQTDIFKPNVVDMYSEAAVDFTDRLHSYFLEKENNN